jgi:hypothetical protein
MEQRRVISVIFLAIVIVIALFLYAEYNKPAPPVAPESRIGHTRPVSVQSLRWGGCQA